MYGNYFTADLLQNKLSNLRGYYSRELNKIKKSLRSGASTEEVYRSQWTHFAALDTFLKAQVTPRASQSNLVSIFKPFPIAMVPLHRC